MEFQLIKNIIALSKAQVWAEAKEEWHTDFIEISKIANRTCLCGHYPIKELCHLKNEKNGNKVIVGNCCVRKFLGDNTNTKMFNAALKNKINASLIKYSFEKGIINLWERDFALDTWRKKILTEKQIIKLEQIRKKILNWIIKDGKTNKVA